MSYNTYQQKSMFHQFGNILIVLGIIPIASFVIAFIIVFMDMAILGGLGIQIARDIALVIALIILAVNTKNIRDRLGNHEFSSFYPMIAVYVFLTVGANVFYYIAYVLVWDPLYWLIVLIIYNIIILIASIFELISWVRLKNYAETLHFPFKVNIKNGSIILAVAASIMVLSIILDFAFSFISNDSLLMVVTIIGFISSIVYIIGCLKTGNSIKRVLMTGEAPEPTLGTPSTSMYGVPPPVSQGPLVSSADTQVKFCIKCGSDLIPDGEFCPRCGWKVEKFQ